MYQNKRISAILLMAGEGKRFGSELPKQFHKIFGKKVFLYTLDTFKKISYIDEIILVCHKDWIEEVKEDIKEYKNIKLIEGGKTRQESSYLGLLACENCDIVLLHDAVRIVITKETIINNIKKTIIYKAVDTCIPSTDTIIYSKDKNIISEIPDRTCVFRGQTPQSFSYNLILNAHKKALEDNITNATDDCQLVTRYGHDVHIVVSDNENIKITSLSDLEIAKMIIGKDKKEIFSEELPLNNKTFVVIGGTGGIGQKIIELLNNEKANVISLSRGSKNCIDLSDNKSIETAFNNIYKNNNEIDGLINCAGFLKISPVEKLSFKDIEKLISVNFTGLVLACKLAKIKPNGHIINISSSSFSEGKENYGIYSATKAAVVNFTQALAKERKDLNVNVVIPSRTNTKMRLSNFQDDDIDSLLPPEETAKIVIKLLKQNKLSGLLVDVKK